jgi:hypothetical protein
MENFQINFIYDFVLVIWKASGSLVSNFTKTKSKKSQKIPRIRTALVRSFGSSAILKNDQQQTKSKKSQKVPVYEPL